MKNHYHDETDSMTEILIITGYATQNTLLTGNENTCSALVLNWTCYVHKRSQPIQVPDSY